MFKKPNRIKKTINIILYNVKTSEYTLITKLLDNFKLFFNN